MLNWVGDSKRTVIFTFFLAFSITAFYRVDWFYYWSQWGRKSEEEAWKEFEATANYEKAVMAEKGENYSKAAALYEKALSADAKNLQARFNLARIYLNKLENRENAIRQLKKLKETAPAGHPYQSYAEDELKNITSRFMKK